MTAIDTVELRHVPPGDIERSPRNPRRDETASPEMVDSVRAHGILQPLVVRQAGVDGYQLIAGHRRLAAAHAAGLSLVPVVVRAVADDLAALELTLIENLHRQDLSPLEEADGFRALAELGLTQRQIAEKVNVSQPLVSKRLGLLKLPEKARDALDSGGITIDQAVALAALPTATVEKVLAAHPRERTWQIDNAVRKHVWEKKRAKTIADLEAKGVRIVEDGPGWNRAHSPVRLTEIDDDLPEGFDHSSEPCHGAYVGRDGEVILVCTDPARHPEPARPVADAGAKPAPGRETAEQRAEREATAARIEAGRDRIKRRRNFCEHLLERPARTAEVVALASYMFTCNDGYETDVAAAMKLLGSDPTWDRASIEARELIVADQAWGQKFLFALALDLGLTVVVNDGFDREDREDREDDDPDLQPVRFFLAWLEAHGYELDDVERVLLYGEQLTIDEDGSTPETAQVDAETEPAGPGPTITVAKYGKRWRPSCSVCGPLSKSGNTTEAYAEERGRDHLAAEHGQASG